VADFDCNTLCVVAGACPPPDPPSEEIEGEEEVKEKVEEKENVDLGLDLLHPTVLSVSSSSSTPALRDDPPVDLCGICTSVLTQLHEAVTDPDKQRQAMATAARVCSALRRFRDECLGDVQQYGPIVIDTVGQYVGPDVCVAAGICSTSPQSSSSKRTTVDVA